MLRGPQGAPEAILSRCSHAVSNSGGRGAPFPLAAAARAAVMQQVDELGGGQALRCLSFACRAMPAGHHEACSLPLQSTFPPLLPAVSAPLVVRDSRHVLKTWAKLLQTVSPIPTLSIPRSIPSHSYLPFQPQQGW